MVLRIVNNIAKPLLYSLLIHIILFIILLNNQDIKKHQQDLSEHTPIKSYLYYRAAENEPKLTLEPLLDLEVKSTKSTITQSTNLTQNAQMETVVQDKPILSPKLANPPHPKNLSAYPNEKNQPKLLSPQEHLNQLRSSMNNKILKAPHYSRKDNQNLTVFNPSPKLVGKSVKKATIDEIVEKTTTQYSNEIAIIKHDNGTCTIKQDLSSVGMEGITSNQYFKCGESKADKHFRLHMKKVKERMDY